MGPVRQELVSHACSAYALPPASTLEDSELELIRETRNGGREDNLRRFGSFFLNFPP